MRKVSIITIISVAVIAASLAPAGVSAAESETPVATVHISAGQILWEPHAKGNSLAVTVSGPDGYSFSHVYKKNELAIFEALDPDGEPLPDGSYTYEIQELTDKPRKREKNDPQGLPGKRKGQAPLFLTQSGSFTVLNGVLVDPNLQEEETEASTMRPSAAAPNDPVLNPQDVVINDDLIVGFSACIGNDCVNGESFGFDTLRLKENNLRLHFWDTSSTASFPSTDWRLTANDSTNGGQNRFSIEDASASRIPFTIEGSAPSHSLYVDDGGRVGVGTSTPVVEIHNRNGDSPTLRLEQDGSSGFTPQTWDVAGNETNFFIRDATNGSRLPFRIRPGAPSNSIFIDTDGDVGLGNSAPADKLDVSGNVRISGAASPRITLVDTTDDASDKPGFVLDSPAAASDGNWVFETDNAGNFQIDFTPSTNPELVISDNPTGNGQVTINGNLVVNGTCTGCDAVFQSDFDLESIEEHESLMYERSYLPAVGPTPEGQTPIDVYEKTTGILQELEKAHIYIAQLNREKKALEQEQARMRSEIDELRTLVTRLLEKP